MTQQPKRRFQTGDTVAITVTGKVEQITSSGYVVDAHGVSVPVLDTQAMPDESLGQRYLARRILGVASAGHEELGGIVTIESAKEDSARRIRNALEYIILLCQKELGEYGPTTKEPASDQTAED